MMPRVACPTGRADVAESAPSTPLRSAAHVRTHIRVGTVRWHPPLHLITSSGYWTNRVRFASTRPSFSSPPSLCSARACTVTLPTMVER
jgi:hypothetical protein